MIKVGITGHRGLPPETVRSVDDAIRAQLAILPVKDPLVGVTCLADGADQIFAQAVVDHGGTLEVIVPAATYRAGLPRECWRSYDALLAQAQAVHRLPHQESNETAHMDASRRMLRIVQRLFAVWDGQPARGYGGTADVVALARAQQIPVVVVWPDGAFRD
ncbi:MAG: hypothetical protein M3308_03150 [Actinomycetota bacterium]|nr:hypothetical protein [Actinomycetota bacterium]